MAEVKPLRASRRPDRAVWICMVGYTLLVFARHSFMNFNGVAAISFNAGILATALLFSDRRAWGLAVAVAAIDNLLANSLFGFSARSFLNIPEGMALAWLIRRYCPRSLNFAQPQTLLRFLLQALIPACGLSAILMPLLPGPRSTVDSFSSWVVGHALGAAMAIPTLTILLRHQRPDPFKRPAWELPLLALLIGAYIAIQFSSSTPLLSLFIFPMTLFVAFRYGPVGVSTLSLLMMTMVMMRIYSSGLWPQKTTLEQIQWVQLLVAIVYLTSLLAAGALAQLRRTQRILARRTRIAQLARRRADRAAQVKVEFLANMSHEIRTPLNGVIGLTDALSRMNLTGEQREVVTMIQSSGHVLNGLLSDVLDISRVDMGALKLSSEPFDPRETIGAAAYLFESVARDKGVAFEVAFNLSHTGMVAGDALRIRQIVSNLIGNAVKFTEAGRVAILVGLIPLDDGWGGLSVTVTDTGPGFDEAVKSRLFNRFEQGDHEVTRKFGGTGLGLAISRQLADLMGGTISCDSAPGRGATFTFGVSLPLTAAAPAEPARPAAAAAAIFEQPGLFRPRVLLAEDHPVNQRVVQVLLGDTVDLTIVDDGLAAIEAHQGQSFDVILMDSQMPGLDGLAATRRIRETERARGDSTFIISLSADALPQQVQAALAAGADLHLAKPITAEKLFQALSVAMADVSSDTQAGGDRRRDGANRRAR